MASGCLSVPKAADVPGVERFGGAVYYTSRCTLPSGIVITHQPGPRAVLSTCRGETRQPK
jgi:hypothetical protein